jgi:glycosyltransferase involved in cell wall biosynthesis
MVTGTEAFTREVCRRLPALLPEVRWRFFASRPAAGIGVDVMVLPMRRLWSQARLPLHLASERPDLLFVPAHALPFAWPGRSLTVIHDLAFDRFPEAYRFGDRVYLRFAALVAANRSKPLIAVSESTKQDLVELYHVPERQIHVVPLGLNAPLGDGADARGAAGLGVNGRFVLQVGRVEPRKNPQTALAAVEKLGGDLQLVVAGPERDRALSASLRDSPRCRVLGAVDGPTLELLYSRAEAVVVPSLYEGFGLPVLEAMARGKVVVAAKVSSLPEVGGNAALYFHDPRDSDALARALEVALGDMALRKAISRAARARAALFSWERTAEGVAAVIRETLGLR